MTAASAATKMPVLFWSRDRNSPAVISYQSGLCSRAELSFLMKGEKVCQDKRDYGISPSWERILQQHFKTRFLGINLSLFRLKYFWFSNLIFPFYKMVFMNIFFWYLLLNPPVEGTANSKSKKLEPFYKLMSKSSVSGIISGNLSKF